MQLRDLMEMLIEQAEAEGIVFMGSLDFDLGALASDGDQAVATIIFHADTHSETGETKPHLDAIKVVNYSKEDLQRATPAPSPEQFPPGWRPKGVG